MKAPGGPRSGEERGCGMAHNQPPAPPTSTQIRWQNGGGGGHRSLPASVSPFGVEAALQAPHSTQRCPRPPPVLRCVSRAALRDPRNGPQGPQR